MATPLTLGAYHIDGKDRNFYQNCGYFQTSAKKVLMPTLTANIPYHIKQLIINMYAVTTTSSSFQVWFRGNLTFVFDANTKQAISLDFDNVGLITDSNNNNVVEVQSIGDVTRWSYYVQCHD